MKGTPCQTCPLRSSKAFVAMTEEEVRFMESFKSGELRVEPGTTLLMEGSNAPHLYTVLDGMGLRSVMLENGRRQVINFVLPGDLVGLQAAVMDEMKHSVEAVTAMTLCVFRRDSLWSLYEKQPARAFDVTWIAAAAEHFLGEALATVGQREAIERVAWALLKLDARLSALGLVENGMTPLPYRQQDLADALGLSLVHTNKTLKKLRESDIVSWHDGLLDIHDRPRLTEIAKLMGPLYEARPLI